MAPKSPERSVRLGDGLLDRALELTAAGNRGDVQRGAGGRLRGGVVRMHHDFLADRSCQGLCFRFHTCFS